MIDLAEAFSTARPPRLLLAASNGGHLEQLWRLSQGSTIDRTSEWVTFESPQATGLLSDQPHHYIPEILQRDLRGALRAVPRFRRLLAGGGFDGVVSTGAAIAAPAFLAARSLGLPTHYIESVSRVDGPSMTGRLVDRTRLARSVWTQHRHWSDKRWAYRGSVLDSFESYTARESVAEPCVFVTLGTIKKYPFPRPVEALSPLVCDRSIWQLGVTPPVPGMRGEVCDFFSSSRFDQSAKDADVVISHAGVGSVLRLLELGIYPVLVIRRSKNGEHIDDHQAQIARLLAERDLALVREADEVTPDDLALASTRRVRPLNSGLGVESDDVRV
ncbi:glycosyltransferase [Rathayibacter sp. VKM Ac-2760]|uniref:glycosyltransferase n=1 Tax=Rathayibacter sp. VKM Ac-2760 TaxID=2609253 RepID=UPI001319781B|nr:glycosyltransferase [Rathayibacter sp. VKM Ac-2760]QHC59329.1 glycosyltransferase [Rathayibacter sp. VKM Ac-2760]